MSEEKTLSVVQKFSIVAVVLCKEELQELGCGKERNHIYNVKVTCRCISL